MSSRPTTPTDDTQTVKLSQDTLASQTTTQGTQTTATGLQGDMLATARYPSYTSYSQFSRHPTFDTRHGVPSATNLSEGVYAPPRSSLQSSNTLGAVQSASLALSSDDTQYRGAVPPTTEPELSKRTSSRLRRASALDESIGQSSTEAGLAEDEMAAAPRKKRTRTLTTAHQSSVLLSLLAKTPFPTTAERESVGRQIGLTARKVQVWFQNQRQKQKKASQTGNVVLPDPGATTSAPLPLARQPGFSALHAARMGVVSPASDPSYTSGSHFSGSSGLGNAAYGHPTISQAPPSHREQVPMTYPSVYSRSFIEQSPYYPPPSTRTVGNESYQQQQTVTSSPPRPRTSHSHITPSPYSVGSYPETFHTPQTASAGVTGGSYGHASHPSTSQGTVSDDHSLPAASDAGLHYASPPGDAWRYKPLPPLPAAPSPRDRTLNWEHQSAQHEFRPPPVPPSRSRAFSNPDTAASEQESRGHFTHIRGSSNTIPPPSSYGAPRYVPVMPMESTGPSSYHGHSEYRPEDVSSVTPVGEGHYGMRYGEPHTSPGTASPPSSLSYAEGMPFGMAPPQHGRAAYAPIDRRRNRLSYDSSITARSQLGKRSWSSEDERSTKRARTDDGHITVPLGPNPLSFPAGQTTSPHPPTSYPPAGGSSVSMTPMGQSTLGIHMPSTSNSSTQPEHPQPRYYPASNDH